MITAFIRAACDAALWQTSWNNIHGRKGVELCGREPRSIAIPYGYEVWADREADVLRVYETVITPRPGTHFLDFTNVVIATFDSVDALIAWLRPVADGLDAAAQRPRPALVWHLDDQHGIALCGATDGATTTRHAKVTCPECRSYLRD